MASEDYRAYRKRGYLYVTRIATPRFTMLFKPKGAETRGEIIDDTAVQKYVKQSNNAAEALAVAKWLREAGDAAVEFIKREHKNF